MSGSREMLEEFTRRMANLPTITRRESPETVVEVDADSVRALLKRHRSVQPPEMYSPIPQDRDVPVQATCPSCGAGLPAGRACRRCVDVPENT